MDIYQDLKEKTASLEIWDIVPVKTMSQLYKNMILAQLTEENISDIDFFNREEEFQKLLSDYDHIQVRKKHYVDLLKSILDAFHPEFTGPYRKLAKASMLCAKYLARFSSLENYRAHLKNACHDKEHMIGFLSGFRKDTSLSAMNFNKACLFFQQSGLLDIPYVSRQMKDYLIPLLGCEDDNEMIFSLLLAEMKKNKIHGYELNQRVDALK